MFVPALAGSPSGEVGHAAYQHPRRVKEGTYSLEVDRFPLLLIATALSALKAGGRALWEKYDDGDNLLFRQQDLEAPSKSMLFYDLLKLDDPTTRSLTEDLIEAARKPLEETPLLETLIPDGRPSPVPPKSESVTPPPARTPEPIIASEPSPSEAAAADYPGEPRRRNAAPLWTALAGGLALLAVIVGVIVLAANSGAGDSGKGQPLARGDGGNDSKKGPAPARGNGTRDSKKGEAAAPGDGSADPKQPKPLPNRFKNSLGIDFVTVPAGTFWMSKDGKNAQQEVRIATEFQMAVHPVTQEQWQSVMGTNPSHFSRGGGGKDSVKNIPDEELKQFPVENVSWNDVQAFLKKLNEKENNSSSRYRLPTEAEWEYACRGGATSKEDCSFDYYFNQPTNDLDSTQANFNGNNPAGNGAKGPYLKRPCKVGSYKTNRLGLYDMHGNVWEWCQDFYDSGGSGSRVSGRVLRGGSWNDYGEYCRAANRDWNAPDLLTNELGFRLARVPVGKANK